MLGPTAQLILVRDNTNMAKFEREHFGSGVKGLALSRKLTLDSEWSSQYCESQIRRNGNTFIADKRLWDWLVDSLDRRR